MGLDRSLYAVIGLHIKGHAGIPRGFRAILGPFCQFYVILGSKKVPRTLECGFGFSMAPSGAIIPPPTLHDLARPCTTSVMVGGGAKPRRVRPCTTLHDLSNSRRRRKADACTTLHNLARPQQWSAGVSNKDFWKF